MKKTKPCSNSRLFITEDINNENVWFIRTDVELIARLRKEDLWEIYFYPFKFCQFRKTLKESLELSEYLFKKYWYEKYGGKNALHNC